MLVASPRNHRYLQFEVAGIRRPLCVCGGRQHGREIPLQFDLKAGIQGTGIALGSPSSANDVGFQSAFHAGEDNGIDEAPDCLGRLCFACQGVQERARGP